MNVLNVVKSCWPYIEKFFHYVNISQLTLWVGTCLAYAWHWICGLFKVAITWWGKLIHSLFSQNLHLIFSKIRLGKFIIVLLHGIT